MKQNIISMMSQYCPIETMYPQLRNNLRSRSDKNIRTLRIESTRNYRTNLDFVSDDLDDIINRLDSSLPYCVTNIFKPAHIQSKYGTAEYVFDDIIVNEHELNFNSIFDHARKITTAIVERMKV